MSYKKVGICKDPPKQLVSSKELQNFPVGRRGFKNEIDSSEVLVLSKSEWERLNCELNIKKIEEEKRRRLAAERQALHERSQEQVKGWPNTLLNVREKKLAARKLREEQEEEKRIELDIEEAKIQAQRRREVIEKAKRQQYYETDRVKNFHTALRLTEVLKERDAQVELNALKRRAEKNADIAWREKIEQDYLDSMDANSGENKLRREKIDHTRNFQLAQIEEKLKKQEQEQEEHMKEGEEIRKDVEKFQEEERWKAEQREKDAKLRAEDFLKQIDDVKYLRHIDQLKEEEEDEECRMFAAAKKKMTKMRYEREAQIEREKLEQLERIREKLVQQLKHQEVDEESRITKAKQEIDAKLLQEDKEKSEKRRQTLAAINDHRLEVERPKKKQAEDEKFHDKELLKSQEEANLVISANEEARLKKRKEDALKFSRYHLEDAAKRREKEAMERENDLEQLRHNKELAEMEEEQFQEYARKVIDHCHKRGRNVIAMERAARPLKVRNDEANESESLNEQLSHPGELCFETAASS